MAHTLICGRCEMEFKVPAGSAGMHVRCGYCDCLVKVPDDLPEDEPVVPFAETPPPAEPDVEPERPRRRRRRPRPKPQRAGPVLLIVGLVLFGMCGGCAGLLGWAGRPQWRQYDSPAGGFRVQLPAAPRADLKRIAGIKDNEGMFAEGTILLARLEDYAIVYGDIEPFRLQTMTNEQIFEEGVKGMLDETPGTKIVHDVRVTVSGFPGREVGLTMPGEGQALARLIIAGNRFYVVVAGGRLANWNDPRFRKFIDSFEITRPPPAAPQRPWK